MNPRRVQILVAFGYLGERFHGLQRQPGVSTAGEALQTRLEAAFRQPAKALNYTARTDAGVHACYNFATCWFDGPSDVDAALVAVGAPRDDGLIGVVAERCSTSVHARTLSSAKRYRYVIEDGSRHAGNPYAWQIVPRLDPERMRAAARYLIGEHDFTSFRAPRCNAASPVKRLLSVAVDGPLEFGGARQVRIEILGEAFVRKMVRIIAGTLAEIGTGLREPHEMPEILAARERRAAGVTAPAHGLTLVEVVR